LLPLATGKRIGALPNSPSRGRSLASRTRRPKSTRRSLPDFVEYIEARHDVQRAWFCRSPGARAAQPVHPSERSDRRRTIPSDFFHDRPLFCLNAAFKSRLGLKVALNGEVAREWIAEPALRSSCSTSTSLRRGVRRRRAGRSTTAVRFARGKTKFATNVTAAVITVSLKADISNCSEMLAGNYATECRQMAGAHQRRASSTAGRDLRRRLHDPDDEWQPNEAECYTAAGGANGTPMRASRIGAREIVTHQRSSDNQNEECLDKRRDECVAPGKPLVCRYSTLVSV
jgi:hypothetical protein